MQGRAPKKARYRGGQRCSVTYYRFTDPSGAFTLHRTNLGIEEAVEEAEAMFRRLKRRGWRYFAVTVELPPVDGIRRRIYQLNRWDTRNERINRVGLEPFEWRLLDEPDQDTDAD